METNFTNGNIVTGVDIGGSHITVAAIDITERKVLPGSEIRMKVNSHATADEILGIWTDAISKLFLKYPHISKKIGVAMPGPFDYSKGISFIKDLNKYDSLYSLNVRNLLAQKLNIPQTCILFRNDAEAFLAGEVLAGAAAGYEKAIGITLGTGFGSAISYKGITNDAILGLSPFLDSIADDYFSTRWFVKRYDELTGRKITNVKELTDLLSTDKNAATVMEEFTINLASLLKKFIHENQPDVLVIGGNISKAHPFFFKGLTARLEESFASVTVKLSQLGEEAALLGATGLWIKEEVIK